MDSFSSKGLKGIFTDMTTVFTRAKQYAEETIGTAERTELDQQYESLAEKADIYKQWTERIVAKLEAVVQPNPSKFLFSKVWTLFTLITFSPSVRHALRRPAH